MWLHPAEIAVSEPVIIKLIHKFVEDTEIASSIQCLVKENWTDYATPGDCTPQTSFPNGAELHESHEGVLLPICVSTSVRTIVTPYFCTL